MKYFEEKLRKKITQDLKHKSEYEGGLIKILGKDVKNNFTFSNNRCHLNSYDLYKRNNNMKVKVCWCYDFDDYYGFVHFINRDELTGDYYDDTLGGNSERYSYIIFQDSWIEKYINSHPSKWLTWAKQDLYDQYCTKWLWKKFTTRGKGM